MVGSLEGWMRRVLGPVSVVGSHGEKDGQRLLEVVDSTGSRWYVKQVAQERHWRGEVRAYRHWASALGDRAPSLRAAHPRLRSLVTSAVPGTMPDAHDLGVHRQAGEVLRRLHASVPARSVGPRWQDRLARHADAVLTREPGLFSAEEQEFVHEHARAIRALPPAPVVPCHSDFTHRNWLVADDGVLRLIDFAASRWAVPAYDMTRLALGPWWGRPRVREAFLEGYGRSLAPQEEDFLEHNTAIQAAVLVWYAHARGRQRRARFLRNRLHALMGEPSASGTGVAVEAGTG